MRQPLRVGTPISDRITANMPSSVAPTAAIAVATPYRTSRRIATHTPSGTRTSETSSFTRIVRMTNTQYSRHLRSNAP